MRIRGSNRASSIQIHSERRKALDNYTVQLSLKAGTPLYISDVMNSILDNLDVLDQNLILDQIKNNNQKALQKKKARSMARKARANEAEE